MLQWILFVVIALILSSLAPYPALIFGGVTLIYLGLIFIVHRKRKIALKRSTTMTLVFAGIIILSLV